MPWFPANEKLPTLVDVLRGEVGDRGPVLLERVPGSAWAYSGGGYALLELLVEEISSQPFAEYMHANVFAPLGMERSNFAPPSTLPFIGRCYDKGGTPIAPYRLVGVAAGGLFTTAADLACLMEAYVPAYNEPAGRGVISPTMLALLCRPVASASLAGVQRESTFGGLGHFVHTCADRSTILYHSGGNPGVRTYMLLHLPGGDGLVLLSNSDNAVPLIGQLVDQWGAAYAYELPPLF